MYLEPITRDYGSSLKGGSIARFYINKYVEEKIKTIESCTSVIEVGEERYCKLIESKERVIISNIESEKLIFADLETGEGCKENMGDVFILTNVLSCLFEVDEALKNVNKMVCKGGTIIVTVPGIAQTNKNDSMKYGQYWRFTPMCLERLIKKHFVGCQFTIEHFGNVKTAAYFLYGNSVDSLTNEELMYKDEDYPMLIGATIVK